MWSYEFFSKSRISYSFIPNIFSKKSAFRAKAPEKNLPFLKKARKDGSFLNFELKPEVHFYLVSDS